MSTVGIGGDPIYVLASCWRSEDPAGSLRSLVHEWLWKVPEDRCSAKSRNMMSAQRLDFFATHTSVFRCVEEAGLPEPSYNLQEAVEFVGRLKAFDHLALYLELAESVENVYGIQLVDIAQTNFGAVFGAEKSLNARFIERTSGWSRRALEVDRLRSLSSYIWDEVEKWPELRRVDATEFGAALAGIR